MKPLVLKAFLAALALTMASAPKRAGAAEPQATPTAEETPAAAPSPAPSASPSLPPSPTPRPAATAAEPFTPASAPTTLRPDLFDGGAAVLRSSERVEDAPGLIAVVGEREIRDRGYRTLADLLRDIPGFYVEPDPHRDVVFTRGVPQSVLVVYDGVPLVFDTGRNDLPVGEELSLAHVRRVEVLRGPGTALWGANAFNGIVNIVSEDGRDVAGGRARAEGGAGGFSLGAAEVMAGARGDALEWTLALRGEQFRDARLFHDTPVQYVLQPPLSIPVGLRRDGVGGLQPSFFGEAVAKVEWRKLSVVARSSDYQSYGALSSYSHSLLESDRNERRRVPTTSARAAWTDASGPWSWSAGAFYLRSIHDDRFPLFAQAPAHRFGGEIDVRSLTDNAGIDGRGEWTVGANTLSGGYLAATKLSTIATDYEDPQTGTLTRNAFRRTFRNSVFQLYAQDRLLVGTRWRFTLGASLDTQTDFATSVNPRAGAVVHLGRGWIGKALYGEAIRTPDVFDVVGLSGGAAAGEIATVVGNGSLKPEKIRTAEIGAEYRRGTIANASIAAFGSRADDLIEDQSTAGVVQPVNAGHRFSAGVEALGEIAPFKGVSLHASYAFVRTALTAGELETKPLPSAPEHVLVVGGSWTFAPAWSIYAGNRAVARRELRGFGDPARLGPYEVTDVNVRFAPRRLPFDVSLQVRNLFDAIYFHRDESVPGRNAPVEIPGDRRTGILTLEGRF